MHFLEKYRKKNFNKFNMKRNIVFSILGALSVAALGMCVSSCEQSADEPAAVTSLSVSPSSVSIPCEGGEATLTVGASGNWIISGMPSWLSASPSSGNNTVTTTSLRAQSNDSFDPRSATLTLTCADKSSTVTVEQAGQLRPLGVAPSVMVLSIRGETFKVKVTTPDNGEASVSGKPEWITLEGADGNTFTFSVPANYTEQSRSGEIIFSRSGFLDAKVTLSQEFIPMVFELSSNVIEVGSDGGEVKVVVTSTIGYHTQDLIGEWIHEGGVRDLGEDRYEHTYTIDPNPDTEPRSGLISFCNDNQVCVPVQIIQGGFANRYKHYGLFMRYTATWCPWCPMMADAVGEAQKDYPDKFIQVCLHMSGSDLYFPDAYSIAAPYNIEYLPTGIVDGRVEIENNDPSVNKGSIINALKQTQEKYPDNCGIEIRTSLEGRTISVDADIHAKAAGNYKITVLLLEDNIVKAQSHYSLGTVTDYVHNDVARASLSDAGGTPFTAEVPGAVNSFHFSKGINTACDIDNMRVLVYVQREFGDQEKIQSGDYGNYYVDNAATVKVGEDLPLSVI